MSDTKPFECTIDPRLPPERLVMQRHRGEAMGAHGHRVNEYEVRDATEADLAAALKDRPDVVRWLCAALPTMKDTCQMAEALSAALDGIAEAKSEAAVEHELVREAFIVGSKVAKKERDDARLTADAWDEAARGWRAKHDEQRSEGNRLVEKLACAVAERDALHARVAGLETAMLRANREWQRKSDELSAAADHYRSELSRAIEAKERAEKRDEFFHGEYKNQLECVRQLCNEKRAIESRLAEAMRVLDVARAVVRPLVGRGEAMHREAKLRNAIAAFDERDGK